MLKLLLDYYALTDTILVSVMTALLTVNNEVDRINSTYSSHLQISWLMSLPYLSMWMLFQAIGKIPSIVYLTDRVDFCRHFSTGHKFFACCSYDFARFVKKAGKIT